MSVFGVMTVGAILGVVGLALVLLACVVWSVIAASARDWEHALVGPAVAVVVIGLWWCAMAFTLSGEYHSWNEKTGRVERVAKRLVPTDSGMQERYVVTIDGQPFGIDDTRAALVRTGDSVSLRCKKDYQWGVPRSAHGWSCRWNGAGS